MRDFSNNSIDFGFLLVVKNDKMILYHLTFKCDLDLQLTRTNVSNGTSTPHGEQLCQIIFKCINAEVKAQTSSIYDHFIV